MTRNQLAQKVAVKYKLHLSTVVMAIDGIITEIKEALASGDDITLRGFGTLAVTDVKERNALHFATKEPITIPAHRAVKFKVSKELKEMLNSTNKK